LTPARLSPGNRAGLPGIGLLIETRRGTSSDLDLQRAGAIAPGRRGSVVRAAGIHEVLERHGEQD